MKFALGLIFLQSVAYVSGSDHHVAHNFLPQDDDNDFFDDGDIVAVNGNLVASNFLPPQDEARGRAEDNGADERLEPMNFLPPEVPNTSLLMEPNQGSTSSLLMEEETNCATNDLGVYIHVKVGEDAASWDIKDMLSGEIVKTNEVGTFGEFSEDFCLPCGRYTFTIYAVGSEGLIAPNAGYTLEVDGIVLNASGLIEEEGRALRGTRTTRASKEKRVYMLEVDGDLSRHSAPASRKLEGFTGALQATEFTGESCVGETAYFSIQSAEQFNGEYYCLQPRNKDEGAPIVVRPCKEDDVSEGLQWWRSDEFGQFQTKANMGLCIGGPQSTLKLKQCHQRSETNSGNNFFIFDHFTSQIRYTKNLSRMMIMPEDPSVSGLIELKDPGNGGGRSDGRTMWEVIYL